MFSVFHSLSLSWIIIPSVCLDVFDDNILILQCLMLHPSFCSLRQGNPSPALCNKGSQGYRILQLLTATSGSLLCLLSCGVFREDRDWFSQTYPKFLLDHSSSRKWKWQFHLWMLRNETKKMKRKWNLTKSHKKKKSSYCQRNSWVLESGSSLFLFQQMFKAI